MSDKQNRCKRKNVSEVLELSPRWQVLVVTRQADGRKDKYYCFTHPKDGSRLYRSLNDVAKDTTIDASFLKELEFPKASSKTSRGRSRSKSPGRAKSVKRGKSPKRAKSPKRSKSPERVASPKKSPAPKASGRSATKWMMQLGKMNATKKEWKQWVEDYVRLHGSEMGTQTRSEAKKVLHFKPDEQPNIDQILRRYVIALDETTRMLRSKYPAGTAESVLLAAPVIENLSKAAVNLLFRQFRDDSHK
jgi:hypothetical protein